MAGHASQAVLAFARVLDLANGVRLHLVGKDQRMVVTAAAPERRLDADRVLHVLDGLAVPLVIERGHVVHRALPLIVDVRMTGAAGFGIHEELRGDGLAVAGGRRTGEKQAGCASPFVIHAERRGGRVLDPIARIGVGVMVNRHDCVERTRSHGDSQAPAPHGWQAFRFGGDTRPDAASKADEQKEQARDRQPHVRI